MKIILSIKTYILIIVLGFSLNLYSQDGTMDTSFGTNGWMLTSIEDNPTAGTDVVVQPDGKIISVGVYSLEAYTKYFAAIRYNEDGTIDETFGENGITLISVGITSFTATAKHVEIQPDGKIIIGGYAIGSDSDDFAIVRLNSDGIIDSTFGTNGRVITPFDDQQDYLAAIAIQSDGKIITVGNELGGLASTHDGLIARYLSNGELDSSFGTNGIIRQDGYGGIDAFYDVTIQSDGKILAFGYTQNTNPYGKELFLVRYNLDGSLDTSFDEDGIVTGRVPLPDGESTEIIGYAVAIQYDGKILVTGASYPKIAVLRYNMDGTLDAIFGSEGVVITAGKDSLAQALPQRILPQQDGQFIVTGSSYSGGKGMGTAICYNNDGSIDNTFGDGGFALVNTESGWFFINNSTMQLDGKILIVGRDNSGNIAIARINNDGMPITEVESSENIIISQFELMQNYPNPFNPSTTISFSIPDISFVSLKIYDALGKEVAELINKELSQGKYSVNFSAQNLSSGIYFYQISTKNFNSVKKMILLK